MRRFTLLLSAMLLNCCLVHPQSNRASEDELQHWAAQRTLSGHTDSVHSVAFSPDGKTLATTSWDRTIILWDVETGASKSVLRHGYHPHKVRFSPDGNFIYSSGGDGTIKRWDMRAGKAKAIISGRSEILNLSISSDGALVACDCSLRSAKILDAKTGARRLSAPRGHIVWAVAISPDGKWLAVTGDGKDLPVALWDVRAGRVARNLAGIRYPSSLAFSPDGKSLAVSSQTDDKINIFNVATGDLSQTLSMNGYGFSDLVFSPDARLLAAVPNVAGRVYIFDMSKNKWVGALKTDGSIAEAAFSPDGKKLATAGYDKRVIIWSNQ